MCAPDISGSIHHGARWRRVRRRRAQIARRAMQQEAAVSVNEKNHCEGQQRSEEGREEGEKEGGAATAVDGGPHSDVDNGREVV